MQELVKGDRIFVSGTTKQRMMFFGRVTCMPPIEQTTFESVVDAGYFHHGGVKYDLVLVPGMMPGMQLAPLPINIAWDARVLGSGSEEEPIDGCHVGIGDGKNGVEHVRDDETCDPPLRQDRWWCTGGSFEGVQGLAPAFFLRDHCCFVGWVHYIGAVGVGCMDNRSLQVSGDVVGLL